MRDNGRLIILLVMALLALPFVLATCAAPPAAAAPRYTVSLPVAGAGAAPTPVAPPVRVVWIESRYEVVTPAEAVAYRSEIARGLAYWRDLDGAPLPSAFAEATITIVDPFADWRWLRELNNPDWLTIAIVENSSHRTIQLGGGVGGYGYNIPGGDALFCTSHGDLLPGQGNNIGMCVAHELGHWLGYGEDGPGVMHDPVGGWLDYVKAFHNAT